MENETLPQLTERIKKMRDEKLKTDSTDLAAFLKERGLEIVPAVQLKVEEQTATFEIRSLINGTACYLLRHTAT